MRITENKIEINWEMFFCDDFELKMRIANDTEYMSVSDEESEHFVFHVVETEIGKEVEQSTEKWEDEEQEPIIETEIIEEKWEKLYLVFDDERKNKQTLTYKIEKLKQECSTEILANFSMTDQANMNARVWEINALCLLEKREPTEEELADMEQARAMIWWIRNRKEKCQDDIRALYE